MFNWGFSKDGRVYVLHVIIGSSDEEAVYREAGNMKKLFIEISDFLKQNDGELTRDNLDTLADEYRFLVHMSVFTYRYITCYRVAMNMYVGDISHSDELEECKFIIAALDHDPKKKQETTVLINAMDKINKLMVSVRALLHYKEELSTTDREFIHDCIDKAYSLSKIE